MLSIVIKLDIQISGGRQLPPRHLQPSRDHLASLRQSEASSEATDQWELSVVSRVSPLGLALTGRDLNVHDCPTVEH